MSRTDLVLKLVLAVMLAMLGPAALRSCFAVLFWAQERFSEFLASGGVHPVVGTALRGGGRLVQ